MPWRLVLVLVLVLGGAGIIGNPMARIERLQVEPVAQTMVPVVMSRMLPPMTVDLAFDPPCGSATRAIVVEIGSPGAPDPDHRECIDPGIDLRGFVALRMASVSEGCVGHYPALEGTRVITILPRPDDDQRMLDGRATTLTGIVKVCIDRDGRPTSTSTVRSTGYAGYDATLVAAVADWGFEPHVTPGNDAVPACGIIGFAYHVP